MSANTRRPSGWRLSMGVMFISTFGAPQCTRGGAPSTRRVRLCDTRGARRLVGLGLALALGPLGWLRRRLAKLRRPAIALPCRPPASARSPCSRGSRAGAPAPAPRARVDGGAAGWSSRAQRRGVAQPQHSRMLRVLGERELVQRAQRLRQRRRGGRVAARGGRHSSAASSCTSSGATLRRGRRLEQLGAELPTALRPKVLAQPNRRVLFERARAAAGGGRRPHQRSQHLLRTPPRPPRPWPPGGGAATAPPPPRPRASLAVHRGVGGGRVAAAAAAWPRRRRRQVRWRLRRRRGVGGAGARSAARGPRPALQLQCEQRGVAPGWRARPWPHAQRRAGRVGGGGGRGGGGPGARRRRRRRGAGPAGEGGARVEGAARPTGGRATRARARVRARDAQQPEAQLAAERRGQLGGAQQALEPRA